MTFLSMLDRQGIIVTPGAASVDDDGRVTRASVNVNTDYKLDQLSTAEREAAQVQDASCRLFLPPGTAITSASAFVDADGTRYQVVGVPDRLRARGAEHHVEVLLGFSEGVDA